MKIRHLLLDVPDCAGPVDDAEVLLDTLKRAAVAVGAEEYGEAKAVYVPHGVTCVLFLAESHLLISTWPECRLALVDLLLCNDQMDPEPAWKVIEEVLKPQRPPVRVDVLRTLCE